MEGDVEKTNEKSAFQSVIEKETFRSSIASRGISFDGFETNNWNFCQKGIDKGSPQLKN